MRGKVVAGVETLRATSLPGGGRNLKKTLSMKIRTFTKSNGYG